MTHCRPGVRVWLRWRHVMYGAWPMVESGRRAGLKLCNHERQRLPLFMLLRLQWRQLPACLSLMTLPRHLSNKRDPPFQAHKPFQEWLHSLSKQPHGLRCIC